MMIPFNKPPYIGTEEHYIAQAIKTNKISGDGIFTKKCSNLLKEKLDIKNVLLTTSCSHALDMTGILSEIVVGDEVIMPSFTFVSTANAFVLRGAKIVFVDIRPDTMNINERLIEGAITDKTKMIVVVHYAGVSCEMDVILDIAKRNNLIVVEDAAQAMMSTYKGKSLGTIGDMGCYSFHETKNYSMGEGGALLINNNAYVERAEVIREKGTNRSKFFRGQVDKYSWVDVGSSFLPSEINAAYLYPQLINADVINDFRLKAWNYYYNGLLELQELGLIELPIIPEDCEHNAHMFYIKVKNINERSKILGYLKSFNINAVFHYIPLHSSIAGRKFGRFYKDDVYTTKESERLIRLPLYYGISQDELDFVICKLVQFYVK